MSQYKSVLVELKQENLDSQEHEDVEDALEQTNNAIVSLDASIEEVKNKNN